MKTVLLNDIRAMKDRGDVLPTKAATIAPDDLPDDFWDDADLIDPKNKVAISLRVDPDVLDFFKGQGKGHLTRMNSVLRSYVKAQQAR